jgi:hypothetical protein
MLAIHRLRPLIISSSGRLLRNISVDAGKESASNPAGGTFIHISPSGDFWTGQAMFAAKHLSTDYLRSIPIPHGFDADTVELSLGDMEPSQIQDIYDSGELPPDLRGDN